MVTKLPVGLCCDAVHLNKNMRSMFEKYDLTISKKFVEKYKLSSNKVKFQYILDLMEYEENCEKKMAPGLTKRKVAKLNNFQKMDAKRSLAVFSEDVAAGLASLAEFEDIPEMKTTAKFVSMVAEWFKRMKCRTKEFAFSYENIEKHKESGHIIGVAKKP